MGVYQARVQLIQVRPVSTTRGVAWTLDRRSWNTRHLCLVDGEDREGPSKRTHDVWRQLGSQGSNAMKGRIIDSEDNAAQQETGTSPKQGI